MNENGNAFQRFALKGKSKRGARGGGELRRENICLFAINKICSFFVVRKMEMAFKVVKVERIEAWWLCNYSSGSGLMCVWGGGSGRAPTVKLTRRPAPCWKDHMWLPYIKQTERSNYLLSHCEVGEKNKTRTGWLVKGLKCQNFHFGSFSLPSAWLGVIHQFTPNTTHRCPLTHWGQIQNELRDSSTSPF